MDTDSVPQSLEHKYTLMPLSEWQVFIEYFRRDGLKHFSDLLTYIKIKNFQKHFMFPKFNLITFFLLEY
jgi:hypothetical protein